MNKKTPLTVDEKINKFIKNRKMNNHNPKIPRTEQTWTDKLPYLKD